MQSALPHASLSVSSATKQCRECGDAKLLAFFPRDRSRPDGRWHTCKLCNQQHGRLVRRATSEQSNLALLTAPPPRQRLEALKAHRKKNKDTAYERLPRLLQHRVWIIYHKALQTHVQRYGVTASQPKCALLWACAVSNVQRAGDNSWSRRMRRLKGWRRQRRREFEQQVQLAEIRTRNAARHQAGYTEAGYTAASRLAGI